MAGKANNKVIMITGGSYGSGAVISKKLANEGAKIVISGVCGEPVEKTVYDLNKQGCDAIGYVGDISSEVKAKECITMAVNNFGRLDSLIEISGVVPSMDQVEFYSSESFYALIRNNILSSYNITRYALPELKKTKGTIVFSGADAGINGLAENAAYGGTKGFIISFAKGLAKEVEDDGIKVYCVTGFPIDRPYDVKAKSGGAEANDLGLNENYLKRVADVYIDLATGFEYDSVVYNLQPEAILSKTDGGLRGAIKKENIRKNKIDFTKESGD